MIERMDHDKSVKLILFTKKLYIDFLKKKAMLSIYRGLSLKCLRKLFYTFRIGSVIHRTSLFKTGKNFTSRVLIRRYKHYQLIKLSRYFIKWKILKYDPMLFITIYNLLIRRSFYLLKSHKLVNYDSISLSMICKETRFKILKQYLINRLNKLYSSRPDLLSHFINFRNKTLNVSCEIREGVYYLELALKKKFKQSLFRSINDIVINQKKISKLELVLNNLSNQSIICKLLVGFRLWMSIHNKLKYIQPLRSKFLKEMINCFVRKSIAFSFKSWSKRTITQLNLYKISLTNFFIKSISKVINGRISKSFLSIIFFRVNLIKNLGKLTYCLKKPIFSQFFFIIYRAINSKKIKKYLKSILSNESLRNLIDNNNNKRMSIYLANWLDKLRSLNKKLIKANKIKKMAFNILSRIKKKAHYFLLYKIFKNWKSRINKPYTKVLINTIDRLYKLHYYDIFICNVYHYINHKKFLEGMNNFQLNTFRRLFFRNQLQRKLVFKKEIVEESMRKTVLKKSLYHFLYKLSLNQRKGMKSIQSIALCLKVIIF